MSESQKVVNAIRKCNEKANLIFSIIKGGNHGNVERLFHEDALYNWLFEQKRE